MIVMILMPAWLGVIGVVEDKIPHTEWYNVRVSNGRLALTVDEFCEVT